MNWAKIFLCFVSFFCFFCKSVAYDLTLEHTVLPEVVKIPVCDSLKANARKYLYLNYLNNDSDFIGDSVIYVIFPKIELHKNLESKKSIAYKRRLFYRIALLQFADKSSDTLKIYSDNIVNQVLSTCHKICFEEVKLCEDLISKELSEKNKIAFNIAHKQIFAFENFAGHKIVFMHGEMIRKNKLMQNCDRENYEKYFRLNYTFHENVRLSTNFQILINLTEKKLIKAVYF